MSKAAIYLRLGRVSNVPTVWSNVIAGVLLAGGAIAPASIVILVLSLSLFYIGGMFLNDAFDRNIDAEIRPERPIPSGDVSAPEVFAAGYGMLFAGVLLLALHCLVAPVEHGWRAVASGGALVIAITLYNVWHKGNLLSPLLMGSCRVLVYVTAALATTGTISAPLLVGMTMLLSYLIGLSYIAKQENLSQLRDLWPLAVLLCPVIYMAPTLMRSALGASIYIAFVAWVLYSLSFLLRPGRGNIPKTVVSLIAGISLLDALMIVPLGFAVPVTLAACAFGATLFFQRYVAGT